MSPAHQQIAKRDAELHALMADEFPRDVVLPKLICCYCMPHHVMREGPEPASHGACSAGIKRFESGESF